MYLIPDMIDMGLREDVEWPTESHRTVAINSLIANPNVISRDQLQLGVDHILNIPNNKIETIKTLELSEYGFNISYMIQP